MGVRDQVEQDLGEALGVTGHDRQRCSQIEAQVLFFALDLGAQRPAHLLDQASRSNGTRFSSSFPASRRAISSKSLINSSRRSALRLTICRYAPVLRPLAVLLQQQIEISHDGGQWAAQLVGDHSHELGLQPVGLLDLLVQVLQLLPQPPLLGVEPRVLDGQGGAVGQGHGQAQVSLGELASGVVMRWQAPPGSCL